MKTTDEDEYLPANDDQDDWLPLMDAALLLGKSHWTLYTLVRKRRIESTKAGHRILVKWGSLIDYFRRKE